MNPETDGIDHINVYSKGSTNLGKRLSNFHWAPFELPDDGKFGTIEGYWYWLGCKDDRLRKIGGWQCKEIGRALGAPDWLDDQEFKNKICTAIRAKLDQNVDIKQEFIDSTLPFTHYYVYGNKVVNVPKAKWILDFLEELRKEYGRS